MIGHSPTYEATDKTKLFHRVGKQVFKTCANSELLTIDEIKRAVLAKFQN